MAKPTLSQAQIDSLTAAANAAEENATLFTAQAAAKDASIADFGVQDSAFKDLFDYYNEDIIGKYDDERQALEGIFIPNPVIEQDIIDCSELTGRLRPTVPATDAVRIPEFDGGNTSSTDVHEQEHIAEQTIVEDQLVNGVSGTSPTLTSTSITASPLDSSSTSLDMADATGPMSFSIGDVFVVHDGGTDAAIVKVTGVTDNMGGDPPYSFTLDIELVLPPSGTISSGADSIDSFTGFTNAERNTKTATDTDLQPVMDSLIASLEARINDRKARLAEQTTAISGNDDQDGIADLGTAQTNINTSDSFLTNYLVSTDISDTGLSSLATERATRGGQITTRLTQIVAAYTGQTENYYDQRYGNANNRANISRGTLRLKKNAENTKQKALDLAQAAQDQADAYNAILP